MAQSVRQALVLDLTVWLECPRKSCFSIHSFTKYNRETSFNSILHFLTSKKIREDPQASTETLLSIMCVCLCVHISCVSVHISVRFLCRNVLFI